jgi:hypothetical protein
MAVSALALRTAVHARQLRDRTAGTRRRPVGAESAVGAGQPRRDRADRQGSEPHGTFGSLGGSVRRAEPRAARAGGWRSPQRHADPARLRARAGADRGRRGGRGPRGAGNPRGGRGALPRRRGGARGGGGREGHRRAAASVPGAVRAAGARAPVSCAQRRYRPARARGDRAGRLRQPCDRLPRCRGRAAAARGHPQHSR